MARFALRRRGERAKPGAPLRPDRPSGSALFGRISRSHVDLLRAALLDGDAAVRAFEAWRATLDLATIPYSQQRLLPQLQRNMTRLGIADPLIERFRGIRRYHWVRNLRSLALARALFEALHQNRVPFIVLKGAAIVAAYLDDRSLRPMDDVDILVEDEHIPAAVQTLTGMGLAPPGMDGRLVHNRRLRVEVPGWAFHGSDLNIDLHWRAMHLDRRPQADDRFWRWSRPASLDGIPIRVLDPAHHLLHICAHAAQDSSGVAAAQCPVDAALIIRGVPNPSWERLVEEAGARRMSAIVADSLTFLAREIDLPVPTAVIRELWAAARWPERVEARLRAAGPPARLNLPSRFLLDFQDFRRGDRHALDRSVLQSIPAFLNALTGVNDVWLAGLVIVEMSLGHPRWLRRLVGRDCHRSLPDANRLPAVGDAIDVTGLQVDETPLIAGWGLPEPIGRWTVGREATVAWQVTEHDTDLDLLVDGFALLDKGAPSQDVEIWADDRPVEVLRFRLGETPPLPARIRLRRRPTDRDVLFVTLVVRAPRSPAELGLSADSRALGVNVRRLGLIRAGDRFPIDRERLPGVGEFLNLASTSTDETAFVAGWGAPEASGRWTIGAEAIIAWRVEADDGDLALVCEGGVFLDAEAPDQDVEVFANDRPIASWHFATDMPSPLPARVAVPPAPNDGILLVAFRIRSPRSPAELGLSNDTRALGFRLRSLAIVRGPGTPGGG
jgi:hypothetical protein